MSKDINIFWLSGNYHDRVFYLNKIKDRIGDCAYISIDSDVSFEYVETQMFEQDFFSPKRLIVINSWPKPKGTKTAMYTKFLELLDKFPKEYYIVFNDLSGIDKKFLEYVDKNGKLLLCEQYIDRKYATRWVVNKLKENNKQIDDELADMLVESIGSKEGAKNPLTLEDPPKYLKGIDLDRLHILIGKICSFIGNRKKIKKDDIFMVCEDSSEFIIWNLINLLDERDYCGCMKLIHKALSNARNEEETVAQVIHTLLWRYKLLWFIKEGLSLGLTQNQILQESKLLYKTERTGFGFRIVLTASRDDNGALKPIYGEYVINKAMEGSYNQKSPVSCYDRKHLFEIYRALVETLMKIRSGSKDADPITLMDMMILTICSRDNEDSIRKTRMISNMDIL